MTVAAPFPTMDSLRQRFAAQNRVRAGELAGLRDRVAAGADPREAIQAISGIAHRIAGVAATLGHADMGRLAHDIDLIATALQNRDLTTTEAWRLAGPVLERLISAMAD